MAENLISEFKALCVDEKLRSKFPLPARYLKQFTMIPEIYSTEEAYEAEKKYAKLRAMMSWKSLMMSYMKKIIMDFQRLKQTRMSSKTYQ